MYTNDSDIPYIYDFTSLNHLLFTILISGRISEDNTIHNLLYTGNTLVSNEITHVLDIMNVLHTNHGNYNLGGGGQEGI